MKKLSVLGIALRLAIFQTFLVFNQTLPAVTFSVSPSAVSNQYTGPITLQIGGVNPGETVVIEKFVDANTNGVVDPGESLAQGFRLTDGQATVIGGVTNINVPFDSDPTAGSISAVLTLLSAGFNQQIIGKYAFKLSNPTNRFTPITNFFSVTNTPYAQSVAGNVLSNGVPVPNAGVVLFSPSSGGDLNPVAGVIANNSGAYTIKMPTGTYLMVPFRSNFVADLTVAPTVTLGVGATITTNLNLLPTTRTISGKVVDAANNSIGLPGLLLPLQLKSGGAALAIGYTDTNGNFSVPVTSGTWKIGGLSQDLDFHGYLGLQNSMQVDTSTGSVAGVVIALPKATALFYGSVRDNQNHPLAGVRFYSQDNNSNLYESDATTDANGNYVIGILSGNWQASIDNNNPNFANYIFSQDFGSTNVNNGAAVFENFSAILAANHITGNVQDNGSSPITSLQMNAFATINGTNYNALNAVTDGSGNYSLNVANGSWNVDVNCGGGDNALPPGYQCPGDQNVNIANNNGVANFIVQPVGGGSQITGFVKNNSNAPIVGVHVSANGNDSLSTVTDGSGHYSFNVTDGDWDVSVNCGELNSLGYACVIDQPVNISGNNGTANFTVQATGGGGGNVWSYKPFMPTARVAPAAVGINGLLYVVGGFTDETGPLGALEAYNPATGVWSPLASMHLPRGRLAAAVINGKLYTAGGFGNQTAAEVYDPATNGWDTLPSMNVSRLGCGGGVISNKFYVFGGTSDAIRTLEVYDPVGNNWTLLSPMPTPRYLLAGGVISNKLYVVGGYNAVTGGSALATVEVYDPGSDSWTTRASLPLAAGDEAAAVINGKLYVVGGNDSPSALQVYDPALNSWSSLASMPTARSDLAAAGVNSLLFAAGGAPSSGFSGLPTVEAYGSITNDPVVTTILASDATALAAGLGSGVPSISKFNRMNTGDISGLTFSAATVGAFSSGVTVPYGAPGGTQILNIPPNDGENGFFKKTFILPAGYTGIQLSLAANADFYGRAFLNGNPITPALTTTGEITENGDTMYAIANPAFFQPGTNQLLIADANYDGGTSGASFYAFVTYRPLPVLQQGGSVSAGHFQLTINGVAGQNYTVLYSQTLTNWQTLLITNAPSSSFTITDPNATNVTRYYRVLLGP